MNNLKELTWEHHKNAERQHFVKHLMGGSIDPKLYATYLWNQFPCYEVLEVMARAQGLLDDFPHIMRSKSILADFRELWPQDEKPPEHTMATKKYLAHMKTSMNDADKLMAHIYVRHMGDLSGGQMIRKKIPGSGTLYDFEDGPALKELIRERLDDSMADEAKICFDFATQTFQELMDVSIDS